MAMLAAAQIEFRGRRDASYSPWIQAFSAIPSICHLQGIDEDGSKAACCFGGRWMRNCFRVQYRPRRREGCRVRRELHGKCDQDRRCLLNRHWNGWCPGTESNRRHRDFQSRALPTELPGPNPSGRRRAGASARSSEPVPNLRLVRCPASRGRPKGRQSGSLPRAISTGRGPCTRGCKTARDRHARDCRTVGRA